MVVHLIVVILGCVIYGMECCWYALLLVSDVFLTARRGFKCCMSSEEKEDMEATEGGEEAYTGPLTTMLFAKRYPAATVSSC